MKPIIQLSEITKTFGSLKAVDEVSFAVQQGEIFGLLGPNGAGKTTAIRIMLDIFKPDRGEVSVLGGVMEESKKNRIGYLPEERGLYQDISLERCLVYLGTLKGLSLAEARSRLTGFLERFDLADHRRKKIKELSKGMQQKAQVIATLLHRPELLIIDEPFSGLDPVNTRLVKEVLLEEQQRGTTIVMSTHQMNQVEELCNRLVLIHRGRVVLYGEPGSIRRQFSGHAVVIRTSAELPPMPGVLHVERRNGSYYLSLDENTSPQQVLKALVAAQVLIEHFEVALPSLDEVFVQVVQEAPDLESA